MSSQRFGRFVTYDAKRHVFIQEFEAPDDESARSEFSYFYRAKVGGDGWEHRKFGRFVLLQVGLLVDGVASSFDKPRVVMLDDEVRLDFYRFLLADPPQDDDGFVQAQAEFDRLDALDLARLARKSNAIAEMVAAVNDGAPRDG
jgi:hypothetical protein